jgi:hypothetical protein
MCNDYEQHIRWAEYCRMMQALELGVPTQQSESDLPQRHRACADAVRLPATAAPRRASVQFPVGRAPL